MSDLLIGTAMVLTGCSIIVLFMSYSSLRGRIWDRERKPFSWWRLFAGAATFLFFIPAWIALFIFLGNVAGRFENAEYLSIGLAIFFGCFVLLGPGLFFYVEIKHPSLSRRIEKIAGADWRILFVSACAMAGAAWCLQEIAATGG